MGEKDLLPYKCKIPDKIKFASLLLPIFIFLYLNKKNKQEQDNNEY